MNVIFASCGNDSVALIQWAIERALDGMVVAYSDTGWSAQYWPARVAEVEAWVLASGGTFVRPAPRTMAHLVESKKAWPRGGGGKFQFCTLNLKEEPALRWLAENDPDCEAVCYVGIRRSESANRSSFPRRVESSDRHGGRALEAPLVSLCVAERDELIARSPLALLPTKSRECWPCVNANRQELRALDEAAIVRVELIESAAGMNSKGNARVMFSPKRHGGAVGIRAVVEHARRGMDDLFEPAGCDGGWCGS